MSGKFWKWVHFCGIWFFVLLWIIAGLLDWVSSVKFVSHVSMVALVLAEVAAWQASRTEQKEDEGK